MRTGKGIHARVIQIALSAIFSLMLLSCQGAISAYDDFRKSMDLVPPSIASVEALAHDIVEIRFSEPVKRSTAQNASRYFIQGDPVIAVTDSELVEGDRVHLTVSSGMVTGRPYQLSVTGIADIKGNVLKSQTLAYNGRGLVVAHLSNTPPLLTNDASMAVDVAIDGDGDGEPDAAADGSYRYRLNNGAWSEVFPETTPIVDVSMTAVGDDESHTLAVLGRNAAGQWQNDPVYYSWRIDRKVPEPEDVVLTGLPPSVTASSAAEIFVGGEEIAAYRYRVTGEDWSDEIPANIPITLADLVGDPPTDYTLEVLARDVAGNWQVTESTHTWRVNLSHPVAELTGLPDAFTSSDDIDITVGGLDITHYRYRLDGGSWSSWLPVAQNIQFNTLSEDEHAIEVLGRNNVGVEQDVLWPTAYSWTVDATPPPKSAIVLSNLPDDPTNSRTAAIGVSGEDVHWYRYRLDYSSGGETVQGQWTGRCSVNDDIVLTSAVINRDGEYTLYVIGVDRALNETPYGPPLKDTTQWYSWTVDTSSPVAVLGNTPETPTALRSADITVSGATVVAYRYRLDSGSWSAQAPIAQHIELSGLDDGAHQVDVVALNSAGTWQDESDATSHHWYVDITAPVVVLDNLPADGIYNFTDITVGSLAASGEAVASYKYRYKIQGGSWIGGDAQGWSAEFDVDEHIELSDLIADETYVLEVIGADAVGNWQGDPGVAYPSDPTVHTWTVGLAGFPVAQLFNKPATLTGADSINIQVGGTNVTHYRYSIDGGDWIGDYDIAQSIIEDVDEGGHTLLVMAYDGENWQPEFMAPEFVWTVDLTPPASVSVTMTSPSPAVPENGVTAHDDFTFTVGGAEVSHYRYRYHNGDSWTSWSAQSPVATALTLNDLSGNPQRDYILEVVGRDAQGNWMDDASAASFSWTIDREAPAVPAVNDNNVTYDTDLFLDFYWNDDPDFANREIQISTDSAFSLGGVIYQGGTTDADHHRYTVSTANGSRYYARIRVCDTLGNWSGWGAASDGVDVVGSITGRVVNGLNTSVGISAASVTLVDVNDPDDPDDDTDVMSYDTDSSGVFAFTGTVPIGANRYNLRVTKSGYHPAAKNNITVLVNDVTDCGSIYLIETSATASNITGTIVDANWGNNVDAATVYLLDSNSQIVALHTKTTPSNGTFTMSSVDPGTYSLRVVKSGFYALTKNNIVVDGRDGNEPQGRLALCQNLAPYQIRVTVQWGASPEDLDLHVVGPSARTVQETDSTYGGPTNNRFHVFYRNQKSFNETLSSGYYSGTGDPNGTSSTTSLVQDTTSGYGPESINIFKTVGDYAAGVYKFSVHDYSHTSWYASDIVMRVYNQYGMVREISFPAGAGTQYLWKAIRITVAGASQVISVDDIAVVNTFANINKSWPAYDNRDKTVFDW
jgi:hypothetical protein